jgi:hypothetical protein
LLTLVFLELLLSTLRIPRKPKERVRAFRDRLREYVLAAVADRVTKMVAGFEALVSRLVRATLLDFGADAFLVDFTRVAEAVALTYSFPESFTRYLNCHFWHALDVRMVNKMLANTDNFTMAHVVAWNSFVSPAEAAGFSFPLFSQAVRGLMMLGALNYATFCEICPTLDPLVMLYCMQNWRPDEFMDAAVEWRGFARRVGAGDTVARPAVERAELKPFTADEACWDLRNWRTATFGYEVMRQFPCLKVFKNGSPI